MKPKGGGGGEPEAGVGLVCVQGCPLVSINNNNLSMIYVVSYPYNIQVVESSVTVSTEKQECVKSAVRNSLFTSVKK